MAEGPEKLSGAEEYIAAEIEVAEEIGPAAEKRVRDAVAEADGIRADSLGIAGRKVTVYYDPTRMSKDELTNLIARAGTKPGDVRTERSPLL